MKIKLLLCFVLITSQVINAQQPKGPGGNNLYKKGDCERAGVDLMSVLIVRTKNLQ